MIKLAIADDNKLYLERLIETLELENDFKVIIRAENGRELITLIKRSVPDIVLTDIRMPIMNGLEATEIITKFYPSVRVIALTLYDLDRNIIEMHRLGAKSIIGKNENIFKLFQAIRIISNGGTYLTDYALRTIQNYLMTTKQTTCPFHLSSDERKVIRGLQEGKSSTQIGDLLSKSPRTIEDMRVRLYQKFNVANKEQLIFCSAKWNIEEPPIC